MTKINTATIMLKDLPVRLLMKLSGIARKIKKMVDNGSDIRHISSAKNCFLFESF